MMNNGVFANYLMSNNIIPCEVTGSSSSSGSRINNSNGESGKRSSSCLLEQQVSQQQPFASATQSGLPPPPKKRGHLGNPDPDAEIIALSPKSLTATNRFICEICNKGFQRDQNLQLHRRGHNLPWKLKQRSNKDAVVRKKVYVCPEETCVHHDPSRALGDLTGIKKHFFRKHGEKKWKCEKCTKRYAVQSDWKAHSKICGTREYRCDCGTLFSRRDSFMTHRAFCDALTRDTSSRPLLPHISSFNPSLNNLQHPTSTTTSSNMFQPYIFSSIKSEQENLHHHNLLINPKNIPTNPSPTHQPNPNPTLLIPSAETASSITPSPHMSATALLQRAAQMGATISNPSLSSNNSLILQNDCQINTDDHNQLPENIGPAGGPFFLPGGSAVFHSGQESLGNDKDTGVAPLPGDNQLLNHDQIMMMMNNPRSYIMPCSETSLLGSYFNASFSQDVVTSGLREKATSPRALLRMSDQGMARDFMGLKAFSSANEGLVDVSGFDLLNCSSSSISANDKNNNNGQQDKGQYQSLWQNLL